MKNTLLLFFFHILFLNLQGSSIYELTNKVYQNAVHTVLLYPEGEPLKDPILFLNEPQALALSFDMLGQESTVYYYTIVHCTYDWNLSDLQPIEYINGYQEDEIRDFGYSRNTLTTYVHYSLTFPNENLQPKLSGNYVLIVYASPLDAQHVLFTKRFLVVDARVNLSASVPQYPKNPEYTKSKHQVDVHVLVNNAYQDYPNQSLNLVIKQNGRWDNAVVGLKPNYSYSDKLTWEYDEATVFEGGNQFRNFDMKSFKYQSEFIQEIRQETDYFSVYLWPSKRRNNSSYLYLQDIFGQKLIKARDDQDSAIEGDYAWVYFFLDYPVPLLHEDIYLIGGLNDWNLDDKTKMEYDFERKGYQTKLLLKQGYYNYLFGVVEKGKTKAEVSQIEGDFWDTQSEYLILLYFRKPGTVYDQLIGNTVMHSHQ